MYHIPNDARAQKSAKLICEGLGRCLEKKPLSEIRINDIHDECFVSRATFYRLFDTITDVLVYECNSIFDKRLQTIENKNFRNKEEQALYCINIWLSHRPLIKALVENDLGWILYKTHAKNAESLKKLYSFPYNDEKQYDYFLTILSSMIIACLYVYFKHGESEPIEEVYKTVCQCTGFIAKSFNS